MSPTPPAISTTPDQHARRHLFPALCLTIGLTAAGVTLAGDALLWFADDRPTATARQAVGLLLRAPADGLDARDYHAEPLRKAIANAGSGPALAENDVATLDRELTVAMQRYLGDLHRGRIDPAQVGANYSPAADGSFAVDARLQAAVAENRLAELARSAAPALSPYASLREALARYRGLADNPAWQRSLPRLPSSRLNPGENYAGVALLAQRLLLLGDLPAGSGSPARYDGPVVAAVKAFQERHALTPDGVIGNDTFAYLNVLPAARARQIELALERLRWTPLLQAARGIVINVPEFMLYGYEVSSGSVETRVAMKVIVGTARKTSTPLFDAEMRFIEFSPYWNVPPSIARGETLPKLRGDPGYFNRQGFEFVGSDGRVIEGFSEADLDAVQRGQLRIRQRPGASNALGDIKFVFPNKENIYLHHTPTLPLFKRDRRDFSHGCIRVEAPAALAKFVLADEPEWTEERIAQAMRKGKSATIRLKEPVPVVLGYSTATVREGRVYFFPDIYGHDKILDNALRQRSTAVQASKESKIAAESIP